MCQPWVRHINHNTETPHEETISSSHGDDRQVHSMVLINCVSPMGLTKYHKLLMYKRTHGIDMSAPWVSCCCHSYC